ncbi:MAG: UvrD-helicase domain-containing protein [Chlamydiia bacterium]|nr:UvrD-helicase domain-containing protein [Chlamydiia bacterium]
MKRFDVLSPQTPILGHYLLEASAGTGKTFTIEHLTARLIEEQGFEIDEILVVTFTRAATRELKARIQKTLKNKTPSFNIQKALALIDYAQIFTIHGFCHRMLTEYAYEAGLNFALTSEEESDYRAILKDHIADFLRTALSQENYSTAQLSALKQDKEGLTEKILSLVEKEGEFPSYPSFAAAHKTYNELRARLSFPAELLNHFSKIRDKHGKLKAPFDVQVELLAKPSLTLQEFETLTTSPPILSLLKPENQYKKSEENVTPLVEFAESLCPLLETTSSPLCTLVRMARHVQGSARQALQDKDILAPNEILQKMRESLERPLFREKVRRRFRAAIIDEFQDTDPLQWSIFKTLFLEDPIPAFYLVGDPKQSIYSFRSADIHTYLSAESEVSQKAHLDTNYRSDPQLIQHLNALFYANPHFLSLPDAPLPFHPVKHADIPNRSFPDDKSPVHFFVYETEKKRERSWPSTEMEREVFYPFIAKEILSLVEKDFQFSDFAVLVKDRYQAMRLKIYLESHAIPTQSKSTDALILTPTFSLVRSLLEALIDPSEIPVKRFLSHTHNHHELRDSELLSATIAAFAKPQSLQEALRDLYTPTDLEAHSDYLKICELLLDYQTQTKGSLPKILEFLLTCKQVERRPLSDADSVTIMTIHMSKGLEFNVVFALGLVNRYTGREDFIRHQKKWLLFDPQHATCQAAIQNQEAEKLRQLYVALTRAKHRVYIPLLRDTKHAPVPLGQASPLELFDPTPTDATYLEPQTLTPPSLFPPSLTPPRSPSIHYPSRFLHSYSTLAHTTPQPPVDIPTELPKGAETGLVLHSLLETLLKNRTLDISTLLKQKLPPHFPYEPTFNMIHHALHTPLAPHPFTLSEVKHLYPETEFLYPDPPHLVKGFIDLIFRHQGQTYILDWKTNLLPSYDPSTLKQTMTHHDYTLQARLYETAVKRYLNGAPFAGTYYIFLRGLPTAGILFLPPQHIDKNG